MRLRNLDGDILAIAGIVIASLVLGTLIYLARSGAGAAPTQSVVGVVVAIDQVSLTQVNSFDLRTADGKTVRLTVGALDNATQFSLSHLATHMATGVPIRAFYRLQNGQPVVYHLEDAVPSPALPASAVPTAS